MKVALISDIHDAQDNLQWALGEIYARSITQILFLGDMASPFVAKQLAKNPVPMFGIFGNNEGDRGRIIRDSLAEGSNLIMADREFSEFEIDGKKYFLSHYPELAENALLSGKYDAVFHGHTHQKRNEVIQGTPIVCPGEIYGYASKCVSFAIFDTQTEEVEFVEKN